MISCARLFMPSIAQKNPPHSASHSHPTSQYSHPTHHPANSTTNPSSGSTQPNQASLTAAPTASFPNSNSSTPSTPAAPKKRTQITAIAKKHLGDYFTASNGSLNKLLPRGKDINLDRQVQAILNEHGLDKKQLARQLQGFKAEKYGNSQ